MVLSKRIEKLEASLGRCTSPEQTLNHSMLSLDLKRKILDHLDGRYQFTLDELVQVEAARIRKDDAR